MAIEYLDGVRLYRTLTAGIQRVVNREDYLNKINVFPVPDSDTGTNMAYTLTTIRDMISGNVHSDIHFMTSAIADAAIDGARGNSGAILAQFLVGFSTGVKEHIHLNTQQFTKAAAVAKAHAYEALVQPREGTILTVINDWCETLAHFGNQGSDFKQLLHRSLQQARKSLAETPKKLEVLAKAGVVDAGGQGFVDLLQGIQDYIERGSRPKQKLFHWKKALDSPHLEGVTTDEKYRYCTECIIAGKNIDQPALKKALIERGDSIVIAGSVTKTKVHIHTNHPREIMDLCCQYGTVSNEKTDDMNRQKRDAHTQHQSIAVVVDSTCDLPDQLVEEYNIHVVPVRLNFGDREYLDKSTITVAEFWHELVTNPIHPKTSQPTPGDFSRQYQLLSSNFEAAISLHIPASLSGTMQSALTAAKSNAGFPITVRDSQNGSIGLGMIAIRAAEAIQQGLSYDGVLRVVDQSIANTSVYIGLDTLEYIVRGGRLSPQKRLIVDFLRLNPVLSFTGAGIEPVGKTFGRRNTQKKFAQWVHNKLPGDNKLRIGIAHANCSEIARDIAADFQELERVERTFLTDIGPGLGVHAGPGGMVIAVQTLEDDLNA